MELTKVCDVRLRYLCDVITRFHLEPLGGNEFVFRFFLSRIVKIEYREKNSKELEVFMSGEAWFDFAAILKIPAGQRQTIIKYLFGHLPFLRFDMIEQSYQMAQC